MAKRLDTSRSQLDRLLHPKNDNVTLKTLAKAARAAGKRLRIDLWRQRDVNTKRSVSRSGSAL